MKFVKIKEGQEFKLFASNTIAVHANTFKSTDEIVLLVPNEEDPVFCSLISSAEDAEDGVVSSFLW